MAESRIQTKLVTALYLAALVATSTHFHSAELANQQVGEIRNIELPPGVPDGHGQRLSSDDAHHEHSSTPTVEIEICLACRSDAENDVDRSRMAYPTIASVVARMCSAPTPWVPDTFVGGLHPARAPPTRPTIHIVVA